jgi:hypothetical protein
MKKTLIALTCGLALAFSASTASAALVVGDANYIGSIDDGVPSGAADEVNYVNSLLDKAAGSGDSPCLYDADEVCNREGSTVNTAGFADAVAPVVKEEPTDGTVDVTGYQYLLAKYGAGGGEQSSFVWYVGNLSGNQTIANLQALSHISLFNQGGTTVPDGGATLGLLGLGMLGLGYLRRRQGRG